MGLLLRLFDERSRTNPPQSSKTYPQTTKRHGRRNSTHKCKLDALKYFYCSRILNITYRAFYNLELGDINSLVVKNASSYSLRKSLNVVVSRPRTEQGRRSFKHRAAIAWNSLPDTIKQLENSHSFKRKLKSIKTYVRDISFQKECSVNCNKNPEFAYFKII